MNVFKSLLIKLELIFIFILLIIIFIIKLELFFIFYKKMNAILHTKQN